MADGEPVAAKKKSDLGVRAMSAVVMLVVAGGALWLGNPFWAAFITLVGILCFGEFARLVWLATGKWHWRIPAFILGGFFMLGAAAQLIARRDWMSNLAHPVEPVPVLLPLIQIIALAGVVICTDVGAYFAGRSIGGPKIAPQISPSKTWAGLFGGMLAASIWAVAVLFLSRQLWLFEVELSLQDVVFLAVFGAFLAVLAQCGDFFESWLKRRAGVKDSSNLIPGHGGIFDRADGLLPVVFFSTFWPFPLGGWAI